MVGSSFQDVWHMRERMVMKRQRLMSRIGLVLGHGGYVLGLLEYGVTDIIWLRIFAIGGCGMVLGYQLAQPRVQWVTAGWCIIYVAVNVFQLASFVGESPPALSWEEARLHSSLSRQMTAGQFASLLALGEWLWLVDGAVLAEEGEAGGRLFFVTEGLCEASLGGRRLALLGPGSLVGEAAVLSGAWGSPTVAARGSVRCFALPVPRLQQLLEAQPELRPPLERVLMAALAAKVTAMNHQLRLHSYQALLEVACSLDRHGSIAADVAEYRSRHGVSDDLHARLLGELPQCVHGPLRVRAPPGEASLAS